MKHVKPMFVGPFDSINFYIALFIRNASVPVMTGDQALPCVKQNT